MEAYVRGTGSYVPETVLDDQVTVIAVLLKGPVDLYREDGQTLEDN